MKYEDARLLIKTGDILGCHGTSFVSNVIGFFTGNADKTCWTHVGVFFWQGDGLWIAQEYEGTGFGCYPASQLIGQFVKEKSVCYWGKAPESIEAQPDQITSLISTYRVTPKLQPYGYGSLVKILFDEENGVCEDPSKVQAVCSIFAQQAWQKCGYVFPRLYAPEDFKGIVRDITALE